MRSITRRFNSQGIIPIVLATTLAVSSLVRFPCDDLRLSMRLLFEIAVASAVALWVWRQNKWVSMFCALATISMLYPLYSRHSYLSFVAVLLGVVWYMILVQFFNRDNINMLYNSICLIALVNILWLVLQRFNMDPLFAAGAVSARGTPVALMGNINFASALLAICFPAFLRKYWFWVLPALLWGLVRAHSTGGAVSVAAAVCVFLILHGYKGFMVFPLAALILYCRYVDAPHLSNGSRFDAWAYALKLYKQHWLMGSGIGHWKDIGRVWRPELRGLWWQALHNEFLQALFEMGIGFAAIAAGYFADIVRRARRRQEAILPLAGLAAICTNSLVNFPFHIGTTAMLSVTWLAILEVSLRDN